MALFSMLNAPTVASWISTSFPIIQTILVILVTLCALVIIISVMVQPSNPDGGRNVITGSNESFYAENKGSTKEGRLKRIIIIASICILVLTILYFVSFAIYRGAL